MKKTIAFLMSFIFLLAAVSFAFAENGTKTEDNIFDVVNATPAKTNQEQAVAAIGLNETENLPSITPNNPVLWGLKRAVERIDMLITLGKSAKAQKGLAHAKERLLEVQSMIQAKKLGSVEKFKIAYKNDVEEAKKIIGGFNESESGEDANELAQMENEMQKQFVEIAKAQNKIKLMAQNMTAGQQNILNAIMSSVKESAIGLDVSIVQNKNKIQIKINAREAGQKIEKEQKAEPAETQNASKADGTNITKEKSAKSEKPKQSIENNQSAR